MKENILLVQAGTPFTNVVCSPATGLMVIYSALPAEYKPNVKHLDGTILNNSYIGQWIAENKPELVALSSNCFNYANSIEIAEAAKNVGAVTVLGGVHPTVVYKNIHRRMKSGSRPFDYLVYGAGEDIFRMVTGAVIEGREIKDMPNLFSKETPEGKIAIPQPMHGFDSLLPVFDYSMLKDETALQNYMPRVLRIGALENIQLSAPLTTQRGCIKTGENSHCRFCSIPYINTLMPYNVFEASLKNLAKTGADHIYVTDADLVANKAHLKNIAEVIGKAKSEAGRDFIIYSHISTRPLDKSSVKILQEMGLKSAMVGYEHGNDLMLKSMTKTAKKEQHIRGTLLLAEQGIEVLCGGIIVGTPGETKQTLDELMSFTEELKKTGNVKSILASPLYPLPGSRYFREFAETMKNIDAKKAAEIENSDLIDVMRMTELLQEVSHLMPGAAPKDEKPSFEQIMSTVKAINKMFGTGIQYTEF